MRAPVLPLLTLVACAATAPNPTLDRGGPVSDGQVDRAPAEALGRFVTAVDAGRWTDAYALLSGRWRGKLTPEQLAADYAESGPVGRFSAARVRALLSSGTRLSVREGTAMLAVGEGRTAVLFLESGGWRVDALE